MRSAIKIFSATASLVISSAAVGAEQPNILLILVDDLGWNDLSTMGSTYYETPNVDYLARHGVKFNAGYAGCAVSSPSRASILTGKSPVNHGITSWIGDPSGEAWRKKGQQDMLLPADYSHSMKRSEFTLPMALQKEGYETHLVGKWHLGDEYKPTDFGFDINIGGWEAGGPRGGYFSPYANPALEDGERGENLTLRLAQEAVGVMKKSNKPTFTMLSFYAVHAPIQTTRDRWEYYRQKALSQGISEQGFEDAKRLPMRSHQDNPIYAGLVEQMDQGVGYVLDYLKESGKDQNTIIIFTSDNGGVVAGDNFSTSLKPLKGGKGMQWEGGTRVPYIIYNPMASYAQSIHDEPVIGMDIYPTILDFVGAKLRPSQHIDGVSLKPLLEGHTPAERNLYWHYPHYGNQGGEPSSIVRSGDWKLIYYHEDGRRELYNLASDIGETTDLYTTETQVAERLRRDLDSWLKECDAKFPTPDPIYNKAASDKARITRKAKAMSRQEALRQEQYGSDWSPNATWWDSIVD